MIYIITGLIMIALALTLIFSSAGIRQAGTRISKTHPQMITMTDASPVPAPASKVTKAEISARLRKLAAAPDPSNLKMGAMCYKVAMPPRRAEYVCPRCGTRTLYADSSAKKTLDPEFVKKDIVECRRRADLIKGLGLAVSLDESEFCSKCRPSINNPELILVVHYGGKDGDWKVRRISANDMKLLEEFLEGKDRHTENNDGQTAMKSHIERLRELLGTK
jgi:hypothetical protein